MKLQHLFLHRADCGCCCCNTETFQRPKTIRNKSVRRCHRQFPLSGTESKTTVCRKKPNQTKTKNKNQKHKQMRAKSGGRAGHLLEIQRTGWNGSRPLSTMKAAVQRGSSSTDQVTAAATRQPRTCGDTA